MLPVDAFATLAVEYAIVEFVVAAASLAVAVGGVDGPLMLSAGRTPGPPNVL